MNRVRIVLIVPDMTDEEAVTLKQELEKLVQDREGASVEMTLRPPQPARRL